MGKPFVRADVQGLLDMLAAQEGPKMEEVSPDEARNMMQAMGHIAERPRGELHRVDDISIPAGRGHDLPLRIYWPSAPAGPAPALVFYHGGGFVIGDLITHDSLCAEMARQLNMTVVAVDYRLAPEHPFPAAGEDCIAATKWVAGSPSELGHEVTGLVLSGDSAGGNLTAVVSQALAGKLDVPLLAQFLIYPATDSTATDGSMQEFREGYLLTEAGMVWFYNHYRGENADLEDVRGSPIHAESLAGQPKALVFTCGLDPLRDQGRAYAGRLIAAGVRTIFREAEGQIHGCMNLRQAIPSAQEDLSNCMRDLKHLLNEAV